MTSILPIARPVAPATTPLPPMTKGPAYPGTVAPAPSLFVARTFGTDYTAFGAKAVTPKGATDLTVQYENSTRAMMAEHLFADSIDGVHVTTAYRFADQQPVDFTIGGLVDALKGANLPGIQGVQAHGMNGAPGMVQVFVTPKDAAHYTQLLKDSIVGWQVVVTPAYSFTHG